MDFALVHIKPIPKRGEHNVAALRDWLDMDESEISALAESKTLISE